MWDAPERIGTGYTGNGYEISAAGYGSIASALQGWQGSAGHNAVIAQTGAWANPPFLAIGIGVESSPGAGPYGGRIYHVWFGHQADPTGVPDILGSAEGDSVRATAFADRIFGLGGNDTLQGEAGADLLNGGLGVDSLVGGAGNDVYHVNTPLDRVVEVAGGGIDRVIAVSSAVLAAEVEHLTLAGTAATNGTGNALANVIIGNGAANRLSGAAGNDVLRGGGGDDTLAGGPGADRLVGEAGADHFRFGGPAEGIDRVADFGPEDVIEVSRAGFGNLLPLGVLAEANFSGAGYSVGPAPQFVYVAASGVLRWDADGAGGQVSVPIAVLEGLPALTASDIVVIA
jgi:Ca2+-binding RTX toxin-like protein